MNDGMPLTSGKTTKLALTNSMKLPVHFHVESAPQHDENLIAFFVVMRRCINPRFISIVVPDL